MAAENLVNVRNQIKALIRSLYLTDVPMDSTETAYADVDALIQEALLLTNLFVSHKQNLVAFHLEDQSNDALRLATSADQKTTAVLAKATDANDRIERGMPTIPVPQKDTTACVYCGVVYFNQGIKSHMKNCESVSLNFFNK